MIEEKAPNEQVIRLIEFLTDNNLLQGDKLNLSLNKIEIPDVDFQSRKKLFDQLFNDTVNMIDEGNETDYFFIHD